jgi:4-amino-4-deoxy-L-arabinose transferase-like glycosyltransferase
MKINYDIVFLAVLLALIIPYFYVAINGQIIFGDEGFYLFNARWIAQNGVIPVSNQLYKTDVFTLPFVYPPLFTIVETFAWMLGGNLLVKILSPLFTMLTAIFVYLLFKKIEKPIAGILASAIMLTVPTTVLYGILAYTDALLVMNIVAFTYFLFSSMNGENKKLLIIAGIFAALAILTKGIGIIVVPIGILYFLTNKPRNIKSLLLLGLITVLLVAPWFIRVYSLYGAFCYDPFLGSKCEYQIATQPARIDNLKFLPHSAMGGVEGGVISLGFLQFFEFAFGFSICIFFILGIVQIWKSESKLRNLSLICIALFVLLFIANITMFPFSLFRQAELIYPRAEDSGRYILGAVPFMAILAGLFLGNTIDKLKTIKYGKIMAVALIIVLIYLTYSPYIQKVLISQQIKNFPQSWFDGCDWIKANTPKDSLIYAVYSAQIGVNCERSTTRAYPDNAEVQLTGNDTAYEHLKLHGFDYIFIPVNQISQQAYDESYYTAFYQYVSTSDKFKLVYEDTTKYGNNGVQIFKVL